MASGKSAITREMEQVPMSDHLQDHLEPFFFFFVIWPVTGTIKAETTTVY